MIEALLATLIMFAATGFVVFVMWSSCKWLYPQKNGAAKYFTLWGVVTFVGMWALIYYGGTIQ